MKVSVAYNACIGSLNWRFRNFSIASSYSKDLDQKIIEDSDLIIFTGGEDISPEIYGAENLYSGGVNPNRDKKELDALQISIALGKHIMGICRGHQLINAYLGGILVQDISRQLNILPHRGLHRIDRLDKGIVTDNFIEVNSLHHQGVVIPGRGLYPTSYHGGVFESCESEKILTVQFHPEFMSGEDANSFFEVVEDWVNG